MAKIYCGGITWHMHVTIGVVYIYRLKCARDAIYISLLLNTKRLDFYSTADRYAVFIGLRPL